MSFSLHAERCNMLTCWKYQGTKVHLKRRTNISHEALFDCVRRIVLMLYIQAVMNHYSRRNSKPTWQHARAPREHSLLFCTVKHGGARRHELPPLPLLLLISERVPTWRHGGACAGRRAEPCGESWSLDVFCIASSKEARTVILMAVRRRSAIDGLYDAAQPSETVRSLRTGEEATVPGLTWRLVQHWTGKCASCFSSTRR